MSWLSSVLTPLANVVEKDAEELAGKAVAAVVPNLVADLTPIAQKAVDAALADIPFGNDLQDVANKAVADVVAELVSVIQSSLPGV